MTLNSYTCALIIHIILHCLILLRLGLSHNHIRHIEHGSLAYVPNLRELHLDSNRLNKVPSGLTQMKYLQVSHQTGVSVTRIPALSLSMYVIILLITVFGWIQAE